MNSLAGWDREDKWNLMAAFGVHLFMTYFYSGEGMILYPFLIRYIFSNEMNPNPIFSESPSVPLIYYIEGLSQFMSIITARKRSLGQSNVFRSVCPLTWGSLYDVTFCLASISVQGGISVQGSLSRGLSVQGGLYQGDLCPRGVSVLGRDPPLVQ